jgi:putative PIN family toxin of toxin-antitoxin system
LRRASNLTWARTRAGYSAEELAEKAGVPAHKLAAWEKGEDRLCLSRDILDELRRVLGRARFRLDPEKVAYFIQTLEEIATIVQPKKAARPECRDPSDAMILDCARAAGAD